MLTVQLIGFGAIGAALYSALAAQPQVRVDAVVVHPGRIEALRTVNPEVPFTSALLLDKRPDWVVECAGHSAIEQHVLAALQQGIRCLVVSVGALASGDLLERVRAAAQAGHTQAHLLPGAVGGLDALGAARAAGLTRVRYCGRKPPAGLARHRGGGADRSGAGEVAHAALSGQCASRRAAVPEERQRSRHRGLGWHGAGCDRG